MVPQEGPPALRFLANGASFWEISRDRGKTHPQAELLEFGVDLPRSPGVLGSEPMNESLHLRRDAWSAGTALRDPPPVESESLAVPPDHGVGLDDDQDLPPAGPEPAERDPEGSIERPGLGLRLRPGIKGQLLAEGKLHDRLLAAASEEGEGRAKQARDQRQESFHDIGDPARHLAPATV